MTAGTPTRDPGGVRVLLVDDHQQYRTATRELLEAAGLEVVAEASDGVAAIEASRGGGIDVMVIDLHLPGLGGIDVIHRLSEAADPPVVVAVSMDDDRVLVDAALAAGASQFVPKGTSPATLIDAIMAAVGR